MKSYYIYDNGGTPFLVYTYNNYVDIYKQLPDAWDKVGKKSKYNFLIKISNIKKIHLGKHYNPKFLPYKLKKTLGNSILLEMDNDICIYIGSHIYSFKKQDDIVDYFSFIGNNYCPYPVLQGTKYIYFMVEGVYADINDFPIKLTSKKAVAILSYDCLYDSTIKKINILKDIKVISDSDNRKFSVPKHMLNYKYNSKVDPDKYNDYEL